MKWKANPRKPEMWRRRFSRAVNIPPDPFLALRRGEWLIAMIFLCTSSGWGSSRFQGPVNKSPSKFAKGRWFPFVTSFLSVRHILVLFTPHSFPSHAHVRSTSIHDVKVEALRAFGVPEPRYYFPLTLPRRRLPSPVRVSYSLSPFPTVVVRATRWSTFYFASVDDGFSTTR